MIKAAPSIETILFLASIHVQELKNEFGGCALHTNINATLIYVIRRLSEQPSITFKERKSSRNACKQSVWFLVNSLHVTQTYVRLYMVLCTESSIGVMRTVYVIKMLAEKSLPCSPLNIISIYF